MTDRIHICGIYQAVSIDSVEVWNISPDVLQLVASRYRGVMRHIRSPVDHDFNKGVDNIFEVPALSALVSILWKVPNRTGWRIRISFPSVYFQGCFTFICGPWQLHLPPMLTIVYAHQQPTWTCLIIYFSAITSQDAIFMMIPSFLWLQTISAL